MATMRILFITPFGFNDRRRYFPEFVLARTLARFGWTVSACVISEGESVSRDRIEDVFVVRLRGRREALQWLPKLIFESDVVHIFHLRNPLGPASFLLSRLFRRPVVFSEAGLLHDPFLACDGEAALPSLGPGSLKRSLSSRFYHLPLTGANQVVFLSRHNIAIARRLGLDPRRMRWLPHVIDGTRFQQNDSGGLESTQDLLERPYGLFVGQMKQRKGWDVLLKAIPAVPRTVLAKFFFVSPSSPQPPSQFTQLIESLRIRDRVAYFGQVSNASLQALYRSCEVVIIPSRYEGFGLATVEAFEMRKPVVAADVVALNEIIQPAVNGYLVPPDDPEALGAGIVEVLQNEELRRRITAGGLATLKEFEARKWLAKWVDVYSDVADRSARPMEQCLRR